MGLDMYLYRTLKKDQKIVNTIDSLVEDLNKRGDQTDVNGESNLYHEQSYHLADTREKFCIEILYWRKANQIHKWFVDSVQGGEDDCSSYDVTIDDLISLRDLCKRIINDNSLASELLPVQSGFFFGSNDYDEYYFNQLEYTVIKFDKLIPEDRSNYDYKYNSSW